MNTKRSIIALLNNHFQTILLVVIVLVSILAFLFYYSHALTLEYNDATSHLNIARRITHSLTPGLVQIGSNWLPLLHLLEIPFASNFFLWRSGIAGSIVSMLSFIISGFMVFKIVKFITNDKFAGAIGVLAFITNGNLLYMQTAAMFEPLLIVNSLLAVYFFLQWVKKDSLYLLIFSAFFVFLASLTRYDGWFLAIAATIITFLVAYLKKGYRSAEGKTIVFVFLASLGIVLWIVYNQLIFGRWNYFMSSEFSARAQQIMWQGLGKLPARHNLIIATWTYSAAAFYNIGPISSFFSVLGIIFITVKRINLPSKLALSLLLSPFVFNIIALFTGQSIIWVPGVPPYDNSFFNARYGLLMIPAAAVSIGILGWNKLYIKVILIVLLLIQSVLFYTNNQYQFNVKNLTVLKDVVAGKSKVADKTAAYIGKECQNGLILISAAGYESVVFNSGLDMDHFITEGTGKYWYESLKKPSTYASCIMIGSSDLDAVKKVVVKTQDFKTNFILVQIYGGMSVYKIKNGKE